MSISFQKKRSIYHFNTQWQQSHPLCQLCVFISFFTYAILISMFFVQYISSKNLPSYTKLHCLLNLWVLIRYASCWLKYAVFKVSLCGLFSLCMSKLSIMIYVSKILIMLAKINVKLSIFV
jgi:hypothetical protein